MDPFPRHRRPTGFRPELRRRVPFRPLGLAVVIVLMASLLVPLIQPVSATGDAGETDQGTALQDDGTTEEPTEDATDGGQDDGGSGDVDTEATPIAETPIAEETPDTDLAFQADPYTSGIHVNMHTCDRDHGADFLQWSANCTPGGGLEFDVYGGGVLQQSAVDYFTTTGLPAGNYTIRQYVPQDYRWPTVFCSRGPSDGNGAGQVEVVTYEGYYEFSLGPNEAIYCHWFNMPLRIAPDGIGNIWLYKRICPADQSFDYYTADINVFYNLCDVYNEDAVSYGLYSHVSGLTDYRNVRHDVGAFVWGEVPDGQVTITESGWDYTGYGPPLLYCTNLYPGASAWFRPDVYDVTASFFIPAEVGTACHWFTIPLQTGIMTVVKYDCPADAAFDFAAASEETLATRCAHYDEIVPTTFDVYGHADGQTHSAETSQGSAGWVRIPAGQVTVTEQTGEGDGPSIVTCTDNSPEPNTDPRLGVTLDGRSASFEMPPTGAVRCLWITFQGETEHEGESEIRVVKVNCPAGLEADLSFQDRYDRCSEAGEGISFKLDGARTGNPGEQETDASGQVAWTGLEPDLYYLSEDVPTGYGTPLVSCAIYWLDAEAVPSYEPYAVSFENRIEFELEDGQAIYCYWLNIPEEKEHDGRGSITIYKWLCPAGYDLDAEDTDFRATCDEVYEGVKFSIGGPEEEYPFTYYDEQLTGDDIFGGVVWSDLPAGDYSIEETVPEGIADRYVLACEHEAIALAVPYTSFELEAGEEIVCDWYNVPEAEDGADQEYDDGVATVVKYSCPESVGLVDEDLEWYQQACTQTAEGVSFSLIDDGYQSLGEYQTDANGQAEWTGLKADRHYLGEDLPAGYGTPAVFCDRFGSSGEQPRYERYGVSVQEQIQFYLDEGESILCYWFNVPIGDDTATATIITHVCPAGFDAVGADIFDLAESCQGYEDGRSFYAYADPNHMLDAQTTGDPFPLGVSFAGLPAAEVVFTTHNLFGYGQPIVYCEATDLQGNESGRQQVTAQSNDGAYAGDYHVAWTPNAGEVVVCDWFDVPLIDSPDAGTLTIFKYVCRDNGTDYYAADADTIDSNCESYYEDGVAFDYYNQTSGETETQNTEHRGQENSATVVWAPTPAGPVTVTEHAWDGYGTPIVWCWATVDGGEFSEVEVEVEELSADFAIPAGEHVICHWFNIPQDDDGNEHDDEGTVFIYKYFCPEDASFDYETADYEDFGSDPDGQCPLYEGNTVGFDLTSLVSGETEARFTDPNDGYGASWDQVPSGDVTVTEHYQHGFGSPRVFCGVSHDTAFDFFPVEVEGWTVEFEVPSDKTVICFWFNIPGDETPGHLAIYKYFCPEDGAFDYDAAEIDDLQGACEYYSGPDVRFDLYHHETGETRTRYTGDPSCDLEACWRDVPAGDVTLTEEAQEGYDDPVIFCGVAQPDDSLEYLPIDTDDWSVDFEFPAGKTVLCHWFNIPEPDQHKDDKHRQTVVKIVCDEDDSRPSCTFAGDRPGETAATANPPGEKRIVRLRKLGGGTATGQTTDAMDLTFLMAGRAA